MTLILLHAPVASSPLNNRAQRLERVHMFAGRHLGEEEFDREQAYADLRLSGLLQGRPAGIVHGLEISTGAPGLSPASPVPDSLVLSPGLALDGSGRAVSLYYPLRAEWQPLLQRYRERHPLADPSGIYYLLLRRDNRQINAPLSDACQRQELDPTRDTQRVVSATLELQRLSIDPAAVTTLSRERIENWVAADRVDGTFMAALGSAVPLALVAIGPALDAASPFTHQPHWLSVEAGRYPARPHSGYRVLLDQVSAALRRVMQRAATGVSPALPLADFLAATLHLDFLPAAGQLPLQWLQNPAAPAPTLLWLPAHVGVDMVPVPEAAVTELLHRDIARRVIDLRQPAGDRIRLLLAVNEPDYRPDLLDIPPTDTTLEADIYRFYRRAHDSWRRWHEQFNALYYLGPSALPPLQQPDDAAALEPGVLDPAQFRHLDLPRPEQPPLPPADLFAAVIGRADADLDPDNPGLPYPFNQGAPAAPAVYNQWLVAGSPPAVAAPAGDGLVIQYAVALVELEAVENQIRALRSRVEKSRDLLLLMRQQLDSQTVALAALAGGVAGDGSGLQVARWLPYASMAAATLSPEQSAATAALATTAPTAAATPASGRAAPALTRTLAAGTSAALTLNNRALQSAQPQPVPRSVSSTGLSQSLLSGALASTSTVSRNSALLARQPQSFSAFELGINQTRLEQLASLSRQAVAAPAYEAREYRFGVLDHISPEVNEYAKAYYGMKELLATLADLFDRTDAASLRSNLQKAGRADEGNEGPGSTSPFERSSRLEAPAVLDNLATHNAKTYDNGTPVPSADVTRRRALLLSQYRYHALFKAGRILTQWIAIGESRYNTLERKLQGKLREQANLLARLEKLAGLIRIGRETLENLDRQRVEKLGDYGVAQRLLDEDWRQVHQRFIERNRILSSALRGLYYVRVRPTPVSARLADPLPLRHGSSGDLVPGCDPSVDVDLPEVLLTFFATVCEIPLDDWATLRPLQPRLPALPQFAYLEQLRRARFSARPAHLLSGSGNASLGARLQTVHRQNHSVLQQWAAASLPATSASSLQTQAEAARILSLEDLAATTGPLRKASQELRDQLEHAAHCLLQRLNLLPGSVRLQWGQLAEDDLLRVEEVAWWPGLERAEADDFNATRTVAELVSWWFRQLHPEATANSRSAMRNLLRAVLIHAALGDPQEILRGSVQVPPRLSRVGESLQLQLNRMPAPGTRLHLLDTGQQVIATLTVEDHTAAGTRVRIADLVQPEAIINTRCTVVGVGR